MPGRGFWKPGEAKPHVPGEGGGDSNPPGKTNDPWGSHGLRGRNQSLDGGKGGSKDDFAVKDRKKTKGKVRYSSGDQRQMVERRESTETTDSKPRLASGANKTSKTAQSGPSQGLLAMKFMQRSAKLEAAKRDQDDKRKEMEDDFSSTFAKRLRAEGEESKHRLVCRPDHQDPALIFLGRRSFGGFNAVAEAAYTACLREVSSGAVSAPANVEGENDDEGISDEQMARSPVPSVPAKRPGRSVRRESHSR